MKNRLWLWQIPIVSLFTFAFWIFYQGEMGELKSGFLGHTAFPYLRSLNGAFTNLKFRARGPEKADPRIVIVEVDSPALERLGRWPWHRDIISEVINRTYDLGAKVVGLDVTFSEPDQRIPDDIAAQLKAKNLGQLVEAAETDPVLARTIRQHRDSIVLGTMSEALCSPKNSSVEDCPYTQATEQGVFGKSKVFEKFGSNPRMAEATPFDPKLTSMQSALTVIANLDLFQTPALNSGFLVANPDSDGYVRRTMLGYAVEQKIYPTLALQIAALALGDSPEFHFSKSHAVEKVVFPKLGRELPVSPSGVMEINFRGPGHSYTYVPVLDLFAASEELAARVPASGHATIATPAEILKDAIVLIGVSAVGVFDMRAFPFESNVAGVEGHANIIDNIIKGDPLQSTAAGAGYLWIFILMIVGGLSVAYLTDRLEAVPALGMFVGVMTMFGFLDVYVLFKRHQINWNTSLFVMELTSIFALTLAAKYVLEERNKKFIKGAFSKYVSSAVVDAIVEDPTKLSLGGQKKDLTILFSDIRSFTTMSEKMDPRALSSFLNEYLTKMTGIVFETKGTLDKYIGDAVMAFWGAPIDQTENAAQACDAAIRMHQVLDAERPRFLKDYGIDVQIGVGINSGPVSVGNMGSNDNLSYTVIGDDVNLASRLEGLTKYYGAHIVTTRQTFERIEAAGKPLPPHRVLDRVKVKGKKTAVEILEVLHRDLPRVGLEKFEEARQAYIRKEWAQAIELFRHANDLLTSEPGQEDGPSQMYIERCEELLKTPPTEWNGDWEMTSK